MRKNNNELRGIMYLLLIVMVLIIIDFVPIKYAKNYDNQEHGVDNNYYVCYQDKKLKFPDKKWVTILDDIFYLQFTGNYPSKVLSEQVLDNRFVVKGTLTKNQSETQGQQANLLSDNWDILYPIERNGIRKHFSPAKYLTIYDYDWLKVIENWFTK